MAKVLFVIQVPASIKEQEEDEGSLVHSDILNNGDDAKVTKEEEEEASGEEKEEQRKTEDSQSENEKGSSGELSERSKTPDSDAKEAETEEPWDFGNDDNQPDGAEDKEGKNNQLDGAGDKEGKNNQLDGAEDKEGKNSISEAVAKTEEFLSSSVDITSLESSVDGVAGSKLLTDSNSADGQNENDSPASRNDSPVQDAENAENDKSNNNKKSVSILEDGEKKNDEPDMGDPSVTDSGKTEYYRMVSEDETLIEKVKSALESLDVTGVQWTFTEDKVYVGMFITGDGERCEQILDKLSFLSIGIIKRSSISVFPASVSVASVAEETEAQEIKSMLEKSDNSDISLSMENKLAEKVSEFKKSIKSRLVVAQVVDSVKSDAMFTFDYLMLLILASLVAIMGLIEASSVVLVASMLISPLMGPILAGVFGAVIRNYDLLKVGFKSEMMGLGLCILVGFIVGFIPSGLEVGGLPWRSTDNFPNVEMYSRGTLRSLPVGVLIAIPSGAGVALSILGGKVGSLVGVAISASLLPPAVNAGMLWATSIVFAANPPTVVRSARRHLTPASVATQNLTQAANMTTINVTSTTAAPSSFGDLYEPEVDCPPFLNNDYVPQYSCDLAKECVVLGVVSLLLTILNIFCIIIMGIIVLKIKEVAPVRSVPPAEKDFFGKDLKIARESYETAKGQNSVLLSKKFMEEYQKFKQDLGVPEEGDTPYEFTKIMEDVEKEDNVRELVSRLPHRPKRWSAQISDDSDMDRAYKTIHAVETRPTVHEKYHGFRKRKSFSTSEIPKEDSPQFFTIHRYDPRAEPYLSPSPSTSEKFIFARPRLPRTGRFQVATVREDKKKKPEQSPADGDVPMRRNMVTSLGELPTIRETEDVPLLNLKPANVSNV